MHVCLQTLKCVQKHVDMRGHAVYKAKTEFYNSNELES